MSHLGISRVGSGAGRGVREAKPARMRPSCSRTLRLQAVPRARGHRAPKSCSTEASACVQGPGARARGVGAQVPLSQVLACGLAVWEARFTVSSSHPKCRDAFSLLPKGRRLFSFGPSRGGPLTPRPGYIFGGQTGRSFRAKSRSVPCNFCL